MIKSKQLLGYGMVICMILISHQARGQSLKKLSKSFTKSIKELNLDAMMGHYGDSIHYVDPIWGSDNVFPKATVRSFYESMFHGESQADIEILTVALDENDNSLLLKGTSYDTTEKGRLPFVVYFRFEKGKIVEQMDFPVYAVQSLKNAPRYKAYMK